MASFKEIGYEGFQVISTLPPNEERVNRDWDGGIVHFTYTIDTDFLRGQAIIGDILFCAVYPLEMKKAKKLLRNKVLFIAPEVWIARKIYEMVQEAEVHHCLSRYETTLTPTPAGGRFFQPP